VPVVNDAASSSSLASWMRRAISPCIPDQSCPISIENGMNTSTRCGVVGGLRERRRVVGGLVASERRVAVTPADVTPCHVVPTICSTRAIARYGFTDPLLVGMIVGSSVYGTA
jgi:hypothetical protein